MDGLPSRKSIFCFEKVERYMMDLYTLVSFSQLCQMHVTSLHLFLIKIYILESILRDSGEPRIACQVGWELKSVLLLIWLEIWGSLCMKWSQELVRFGGPSRMIRAPCSTVFGYSLRPFIFVVLGIDHSALCMLGKLTVQPALPLFTIATSSHQPVSACSSELQCPLFAVYIGWSLCST